MKTFHVSQDGKSITCLICHFTSFHEDDVKYRHCGMCNTYHRLYQEEETEISDASIL